MAELADRGVVRLAFRRFVVARAAILPSRLLLVVEPSSRRFKSCVRHFRYNKSHLNGGLLYLVGTGGFEPSAVERFELPTLSV